MVRRHLLHAQLASACYHVWVACRWPEEDSEGEAITDKHDRPMMQACAFTKYDSAGIWYDRHMRPCLLIRVQWTDDEASQLMLYAHQCMICPGAIHEWQDWAVSDVGTGRYLQQPPGAPVILK